MFSGWQQQGSLLCPLENVPLYFLIGAVLRLESKWWNSRASAVPHCHSIPGTWQYLTRCLLSPDARYVIPCTEASCSSMGPHWLIYPILSYPCGSERWLEYQISFRYLGYNVFGRYYVPSKCGQSVPTMTSSKRKSWLDTNVGSGIVHSVQIPRILSLVIRLKFIY